MLLKKFRATTARSLHEQWLEHHQAGDVGEYTKKFVELLAPLENIPDDLAKSQFVNVMPI